MSTIIVRPFETEDWPVVRAIYQQGIDTKNATFEKEAKEWVDWNRTMLLDCRLVAVLPGNKIVGWAALSPVSNRAVYVGVAEVSIYVTTDHQGGRIGTHLLKALIDASEQAGFWTLQAGIFPENVASIALHRKCGFRIVGRREKLGQMDGVWRDVVLMERRSQIVGM
jgi:phosphinothricin acetyltransferase